MTKYFPRGVQGLHIDGGEEYKNGTIVNHSETCPDTPQHNPCYVRTNRTLVEPTRVLLEQAGLSAKYGKACVEYVAYVKNRLPNSAISCYPYEKLTGRKPSLKHVRIFGFTAFVYDENLMSKFHSTGRPGIMLGYNDHGVYTVELPETRKTANYVHVTFDKSSFPELDDMESSSSSGEDEDEWDSAAEVSSDVPEESENSNKDDAFPSNFEPNPLVLDD